MKRIWKAIAISVAALALLAFALIQSESKAGKAVGETRQLLRKEGFKTDLLEFDFSAPPDVRERTATLTNWVIFHTPGTSDQMLLRAQLQQALPELMQTIGSNSAVVVWKRERLPLNILENPGLEAPFDAEVDLWAEMRRMFEGERATVQAACAAAISVPIRFHLDASRGYALLLPHVAAVKQFAAVFGAAAVLALHDGKKETAWTNMLAATRLVTAWTPEPTEVSALVRFACTTIAFNAIWQALQAHDWSEQRLAQLQREWEMADFFGGLPEIAAYSRASSAAICLLQRQEPASGGIPLSELLRAPGSVWYAFLDFRRQLSYRRRGSYEDERSLLLHFRDREVELRRASQERTWREMRELPGVTNTVPFVSRHPSSVQVMLNLRQLTLSAQMYASPGQGRSFLGRAAEAESRRRLIVTAIALERYHLQNRSYPDSLQKLVPGQLDSVTLDFMDGQPLRYRLAAEGQYSLYSVGLDCTDDGGVLRHPGQTDTAGDLVWPRAASNSEIEIFHREQAIASAERMRREKERQAEWYWAQTADRQRGVDKILSTKSDKRAVEPKFHGRPLAEVLRSPDSSGARKVSLTEMFTLRPITTGQEPEVVAFEIPISYDVATELGSLDLLIDPARAPSVQDKWEGGWPAAAYECQRSTNGHCLLVWSTIYESFGKHALQLAFTPTDPAQFGGDAALNEGLILGPLLTFIVTNLCQFSPSSAQFNPVLGSTFRAKLVESNALYKVNLTGSSGEHLKTITGTASNSIIVLHWDLIDDQGQRYTNSSFSTLFQITLPDSGKSQTVKGP